MYTVGRWRVNCGGNTVLANQLLGRDHLCLGVRGDKMSMRETKNILTLDQSQINTWLNYLMICQQYDCFHSASTENRQLFNQRIYWKIDSTNKCEKEATFPHTSHQKAEQAWHHWIWLAELESPSPMTPFMAYEERRSWMPPILQRMVNGDIWLSGRSK